MKDFGTMFEENGWTVEGFALASGLSHDTIYDLIDNTSSLDSISMALVADLLIQQ